MSAVSFISGPEAVSPEKKPTPMATIKKIEKVYKDTLKEVNSSDLMINVPVIKSYTDRYFKKLKNNVKNN